MIETIEALERTPPEIAAESIVRFEGRRWDDHSVWDRAKVAFSAHSPRWGAAAFTSAAQMEYAWTIGIDPKTFSRAEVIPGIWGPHVCIPSRFDSEPRPMTYAINTAISKPQEQCLAVAAMSAAAGIIDRSITLRVFGALHESAANLAVGLDVVSGISGSVDVFIDARLGGPPHATDTAAHAAGCGMLPLCPSAGAYREDFPALSAMDVMYEHNGYDAVTTCRSLALKIVDLENYPDRGFLNVIVEQTQAFLDASEENARAKLSKLVAEVSGSP